jgi:hypothetical protein
MVGYMTPGDDEKGNYDDTEFPLDSENAETAQKRSRNPADDAGHGRSGGSDDEGDYDDKDQ